MSVFVAYLIWLAIGAAAWPLTWRLAGTRLGNVVPAYLARPLTFAVVCLADFVIRNVLGLFGKDSPNNLHLILPLVFVAVVWLPMLLPPAWLRRAIATLERVGGPEGVGGLPVFGVVLGAFCDLARWPVQAVAGFRANMPESRTRWRATAAWEGVGLACFGLVLTFLALRTPVIQATEQFADLATLQGVARSPTLPPTDWWLAGTKLNYHYLSFVPYARIGQVAGDALAGERPVASDAAPGGPVAIPPPRKALSPYAHVYLFGMATCYAMGMLVAGGLVYSISRRWWTVPIAIVLLFIAGNGEPAWRQLWPYTSRGGVGAALQRLEQISVWNSSRVIVDGPGNETINEYPLFSLQIGDLHPHLMNLPMVLAVAAGLVALIRLPPWPGWVPVLCQAALVAFASISMLLDIPGLMLVVLAGLAVRVLPASRLNAGRRFLALLRPTIGVGAVIAGVVLFCLGLFVVTFRSPVSGFVLDRNLAKPILGLAFMLEQVHDRPNAASKVLFEGAPTPAPLQPGEKVYMPEAFYRAMSNGFPGLAWVDFPQSKWSEWMMIWGLPLSLLAIVLWIAHLRAVPTTPHTRWMWFFIAGFGFAAGIALRSQPSYIPFWTAIVLWAICLKSAWRDRADRVQAFAFLMAAVGLFLVAVPELIVIRDQYGSNYRINTLFKFYYQAQGWILLAGIALLAWRYAAPQDVSEEETAQAEATGRPPINAAAPASQPVSSAPAGATLPVRVVIGQNAGEQWTSGVEYLWLSVVVFLAVLNFAPLVGVMAEDVRNGRFRQERALALQLKREVPAARDADVLTLQALFGRLRQLGPSSLTPLDQDPVVSNWRLDPAVLQAAREAWATRRGLFSWRNLDGTWWFRQDLPMPYVSDVAAAEFLAARLPGRPEECILEAAVTKQGDRLGTCYCYAGRLGLFGNWPTVVCWPNHHNVRRRPPPDLWTAAMGATSGLLHDLENAPDNGWQLRLRQVRAAVDQAANRVAASGPAIEPDWAARVQRVRTDLAELERAPGPDWRERINTIAQQLAQLGQGGPEDLRPALTQAGSLIGQLTTLPDAEWWVRLRQAKDRFEAFQRDPHRGWWRQVVGVYDAVSPLASTGSDSQRARASLLVQSVNRLVAARDHEWWIRLEQVEFVYQNPVHAQARRLLDRWRVRYVCVGAVEAEAYGPQVPAAWASSTWPLVHDGRPLQQAGWPWKHDVATQVYDVTGAWAPRTGQEGGR